MKPDVQLLRSGKNRNLLFLLSFLLLFTCLIRSGILVDRSFLPRFVLLGVILIVFSLVFFRKIRNIPFTWYEYAFLAFCLWTFTSSLWAIVPSESLMQALLLFGAFVLFLLVRSIILLDTGFRRIFIFSLTLFLLFSFLLAFLKMASLDYFDPYQILSVSSNNNLYSGLLLLSLPFLFSGYSMFKGVLRMTTMLTGILSVFFIIILQSRAVYLGLAAGMIIFTAVICAGYKTAFNRKNLSTAVVSVLLLFLGLTIFYLSLDSVRRNYFMSKVPVWNYFHTYSGMEEKKLKRLAEKSDLQHMPEFDYAGEYYENASLRLIFWQRSLPIIAARPFTGTGAGNWRLVVPSVTDPPNPDHTFKNYTYSQPHNEWICYLAETGIPGLLLALAVFFAPLILIFKSFFRKEKPSLTVVGFAAFLMGYYLYACFDFPFHRIEHLVLLFTGFGLLSADFELNLKKIPGVKSIFPVMIPVMLFSLVFGFYRMSGEYYTVRMFTEERKNDREVIHNAQKAENVFYRITPNTLPVSWFEGVAAYRMGDTAGSVECFREALKYTPYEVRVWNDYGTSLYAVGKKEEGKNALKVAFHIDPFFDDARYNLAAIAYLDGRRDSAWFYLSGCRNGERKEEMMREMRMR